MSDSTITKSIRLKQSLCDKANQKANETGHQNLSEYVRFLIIRDLK